MMEPPKSESAPSASESSARHSMGEVERERAGVLRLPLPRRGNPPTLREQGGEALILAGIAHDSRNLVTALGLCAELLSEPGVFMPSHGHFAAEIRSIAVASGQLVQRLSEFSRTSAVAKPQTGAAVCVTDLARAVQGMGSLLRAIAGPVIDLQVACLPCTGRLGLTEENLSRILVNLVRNAVDAMPTGGRIRITAQRGGGASFLWTLGEEMGGEPTAQYLWDDAPHPAGSAARSVLLAVEDNGPGIAEEALSRVFEAGFTTRAARRSWPGAQHQGLGLSIVRELVEAAGGTVRAVAAPIQGARFEIELPLTNVTPTLLLEPSSKGKRGSQ